MERRYLLSICIPTYNRAPYLKKCLDSLVCQPEFLKGYVEIVISDNASTDNTYMIVTRYQKKYRNITYQRNFRSMGLINGDVNFAIAMQSGHGILRKLGGDTRIYREGSLKYFCNIAQKWKERKPVIYFNNGVFKEKIQEIEKIVTVEHFLKCASYMITWIDTFFLWGEECDDLVIYAKNHQSGFWYVEKTIELMEKKQFVILFNQRFIEGMNVRKKNVSYGIFNVFYNKFLGIFRPMVDQGVITQNCFDYLERELLFGFFLNFILEWELRNDGYIFSEKENLKDAVFQQYHEKIYFKDLLWAYNKAKLKWRIKKIPILGMLLVKLKHKI